MTPSTAHLWTRCALNPRLTRDVRGDLAAAHDDGPGGTDAQREGQAADWVANGVLRGDASTAAEFEGETAPNGWTVTPDMVRHVQGYVDYCRSRGEVVHTQVPIDIGELSIRGRVDAQVVSGSTLELIDLKYGYEIVEPEWNAQLICEAVALFDPNRHADVILTIYQPRPHHPSGPARSWTISASEFVAVYRWLSERAHAALSPAAKGTVGVHCLRCAGRSRCASVQQSVYLAFDHISSASAGTMSAGQLADELRFLDLAQKLVNSYASAIEAETEARMRRGEYVPGFGWDISKGDREWKHDAPTIHAMTGVDPWKQVMKSPAELEREGADPKIIQALTTRHNRAPKLAPVSTKTFDKLFGKSHG